MKPAALLLACLCALAVPDAQADEHERRGGGIYLAGELVRLDTERMVRFSERQLRETAAPVRAGLSRWAATPQGRRFLAHFTTDEYRIEVVESFDEPGIGRAPEPGINTIVTSADRAKLKIYRLILNPTPLEIPKGMRALPFEPSSTADLMAAAWAAEMLHIYLYSQGVRLPHHRRRDFQEQWTAVAAELGFPAMTHGEDEAEPARRSARTHVISDR